LNHVLQSGVVVGTEQAVDKDNHRNPPQSKLGDVSSQCSQNHGNDFAKHHASHPPSNSNTDHMEKLTQKGHANLLERIGPRGCLLRNGFRSDRLDRKLTAIRDCFGLLLSVRNLNHGQHFGRSGTRIGSQDSGTDLDVNIGSLFDQGLEMSGDIGIVGSPTLIRLLNHQHY
jgi:hypothetical protein